MDSESACLDGWDRVALNVDHAMLNKFRGPKDNNFKQVAHSIVKFAIIAIQNLNEKNDTRAKTAGGSSLVIEERQGKAKNTRIAKESSFAIEENSECNTEDNEIAKGSTPIAVEKGKGKATDTETAQGSILRGEEKGIRDTKENASNEQNTISKATQHNSGRYGSQAPAEVNHSS